MTSGLSLGGRTARGSWSLTPPTSPATIATKMNTKTMIVASAATLSRPFGGGGANQAIRPANSTAKLSSQGSRDWAMSGPEPQASTSIQAMMPAPNVAQRDQVAAKRSPWRQLGWKRRRSRIPGQSRSVESSPEISPSARSARTIPAPPGKFRLSPNKTSPWRRPSPEVSPHIRAYVAVSRAWALSNAMKAALSASRYLRAQPSRYSLP